MPFHFYCPDWWDLTRQWLLTSIMQMQSVAMTRRSESQSPQTVTYGPYLHAFANKDLLEHNNAHSFALSMATLTLQWKSWNVWETPCTRQSLHDQHANAVNIWILFKSICSLGLSCCTPISKPKRAERAEPSGCWRGPRNTEGEERQGNSVNTFDPFPPSQCRRPLWKWPRAFCNLNIP